MGYPTITLTIFDGTGRANPIRLALYVADIPFEDECLSPGDWASFRAAAPFGQSPIMTVNGTEYAQASALLRFVGNIADLLPTNPILMMAVDEIVTAVDAFFNAVVLMANPGLDEETRRQLVEAAYGDTFLNLFKTLNHLVGQQAKGFAVGDQLTIADLSLFGLIDSVKRGAAYPVGKDALDRYDNLTDLYKNVMKQPKVAEWMASLS